MTRRKYLLIMLIIAFAIGLSATVTAEETT